MGGQSFTVTPARAAHVAGATYTGTHSGVETRTVTFTVTGDGSGIASFGATNIPGNACTFTNINVSFSQPLSIGDHAFTHTVSASVGGLAFTGSFPAAGSATGTLRATQTAIYLVRPACDSGIRTWTATAPLPPPPVIAWRRFTIDLACPPTAAPSALVPVAVNFSNATETARTVTQGALALHAGTSRLLGPRAVDVSATIEPGVPIELACPECVWPVEATTVTVPLQIPVPPRVASRTLLSVGLAFFGRVGEDPKRRPLGHSACVIEIE